MNRCRRRRGGPSSPGFVGFAVDFFDIYLPSLVLAPVMQLLRAERPEFDGNHDDLLLHLVATLLGRPCGAVIFGHWADKIGRRRTTMISIAGFGIFTALIAFVPGYATIGAWSLILLIADPLRGRGVHGRRIHLEQHAGAGDGAEGTAAASSAA